MTGSLDILMPVYQEEGNIKDAAQSILSAAAGRPQTIRVVIVDDGSTDGTPALADALARQHPASVAVTHQPNQGIGGAIQTGLAQARAEYVMIWPADMRLSPEILSAFAEKFGQADVIAGYRASRQGYTALMKFNSRLFTLIIRWICGLRLRDVTWVCAYRLRTLTGVRLRENGVAIFPELLLTAKAAGASFAQIPVPMQPRLQGTASAAKFKTMRRALSGLLRLCWRYHRLRDAQSAPQRPT